AQTRCNLFGSAALPGEFVVSGPYQVLPRPVIVADYPAGNAVIAPTLGRNLAGGVQNVIVPLIAPQTMWEGWITRLGARVSKIVRITERARIQLNVDVYNVLNSSSIRSIVTAFGMLWRQPTQILDPRIFQLSAQVNF